MMPHNPFVHQRPPKTDWQGEWCTCNHHIDVHSFTKSNECQICLCSRFQARTKPMNESEPK